MKLHLFDTWHVSHHDHSKSHENLKYGTLLIIGIPVVVIVSRYIIDTVFNMF